MQIINNRKAGKSESYDGESVDMLSILISSEYFSTKPDLIIDEFIGMFMAGMKTSQATLTNLI